MDNSSQNFNAVIKWMINQMHKAGLVYIIFFLFAFATEDKIMGALAYMVGFCFLARNLTLAASLVYLNLVVRKRSGT